MSDCRSRNMNRSKRRGVGISSGPLVTNHIRNLNEELEMLQRRRELLHHEQQMLSNEMFNRKRPYENDQLPRNFEFAPQYSTTQNFAHLYDNAPGSGYGFSSPQPINKRHHINVWDDDRYNMNQIAGGPRHGPFAGPNLQRMSPPKPLMSIIPKPSIGRRISGSVPQRNRKDFVPSKVTKPKVKPYNNKPAVANEKIIPSLNKNVGGQKLLADQVPSQQVAGRLELALGAILKQMKDHYPTNEDPMILFNSKHVQRSIKQSIRERLRSVMLDKVVGRFADVVEIYRKTYPASTDKEILDNALFNADSLHLVPRYFNKVLTNKLDNLFARLQLLSEGKEAEIENIIKSRPSLLEESAEETKTKNANAKLFYTSLLDALLEDRIPKLLPNYTEQIVKLLEESKESKSDDKASKDSKNEENMTIINDDAEECTEKNTQITGTDEEKRSDVVQLSEMGEKINIEGNDVVEISNTGDKIDIETSQIDENMKEFVEESVKNIETEEKEVVSKPLEEADDSMADVSIDTQAQQRKYVCTPSKYFVKVLGQPSLPNRIDAYTFLNKFNAVSIKKHKVIQNLLVVGFDNEKDFNDAIAASGSLIGTSNLIIRANDKLPQNNSSPSPKENKNDKEISNTDKISIPLDLENQITELLTSIRKSDEDDKTEIIKEIDKDDSVVSTKTDIETKEDCGTILNNSEQPDFLNSTQNNRDDNNPKAKNETKTTSGSSDENYRSMEIIKEDNDGKELSSVDDASVNTVVENNDVKNVKANPGCNTPMKTTRQSVAATPRTIRTRRSSRLMPNN